MLQALVQLAKVLPNHFAFDVLELPAAAVVPSKHQDCKAHASRGSLRLNSDAGRNAFNCVAIINRLRNMMSSGMT